MIYFIDRFLACANLPIAQQRRQEMFVVCGLLLVIKLCVC